MLPRKMRQPLFGGVALGDCPHAFLVCSLQLLSDALQLLLRIVQLHADLLPGSGHKLKFASLLP